MRVERLPNPILTLGGEALEHGLNALVALDPAMPEALEPLDRKRVTLTWRDSGLALEVRVADGRLHVGPADDSGVDLAVTTSLSGLLGMFLPGKSGALPTGKVEIAGDAELARHLERLVRRFAPDFDAALERVFGQSLGFALARGLREGLGAARQGFARFADDTAEYLKTESRVTIAREELEDFCDAVDTLRDDVERAAARLAALKASA